MAKSLQEQEDMLMILKFHFLRPQHRMKQVADRHRSERFFELGDWVFLKLQPYRQQSVVQRFSQNITPKDYGSYRILDKVGVVAYKLQLPTSFQIHPVFHVSQFKRLVGNATTSNQLPSVLYDVSLKEPTFCLARKMVQRQAATMVLVQWSNQTAEEATWEYMFDMKKKFPAFEF